MYFTLKNKVLYLNEEQMDEIKVQEELAFIKKVMDDTKQSFIHNGKPFITWGVIVIIGQLATFFGNISHRDNYIWALWGILALIGWILSYFNYKKEKKNFKAVTIVSKAINSIWFSCGISIMILVFIAPMLNTHAGGFINPIVSTLLGTANFTTGSVSYKWLRYVAVGWWCGAIVMFIWPGLYTLLFMSVLLLAFQVTPGMIINSQWRKSIALKNN